MYGELSLSEIVPTNQTLCYQQSGAFNIILQHILSHITYHFFFITYDLIISTIRPMWALSILQVIIIHHDDQNDDDEHVVCVMCNKFHLMFQILTLFYWTYVISLFSYFSNLTIALLAGYMLVGNVMLLNLLIAIFTSVFEEIQANSKEVVGCLWYDQQQHHHNGCHRGVRKKSQRTKSQKMIWSSCEIFSDSPPPSSSETQMIIGFCTGPE